MYLNTKTKNVLFSEFIMAWGTYFTAACLKITSINQNNLVGSTVMYF